MRSSNSFVKLTAVFTVLAFASGCTASTVIRSKPEGAKVYLNGESVGVTPYTMTDTKIIGSSTTVRLVKEGYEDYNTVISRTEEIDAGPAIAGFLCGVWPWLWAMKYKPEHAYELERKR